MRRSRRAVIAYRNKELGLDYDIEAIQNLPLKSYNIEKENRKKDKVKNRESKSIAKESKNRKKSKTIDNMSYEDLVHYAIMLGLSFPEDIDIEELNLMVIKAGG